MPGRINTKWWESDLRFSIQDLPVIIRFPYKGGALMEVSFQSGAEILDPVNGGLVEGLTGTIVGVKSDFKEGFPEDDDDIAVQARDGTWRKLTVKSVSGADDPQAMELILVIGTPG